MKIRNLMLALAGTALVFSACEKDPNPKVPTTDANIALATILFRDTWAIARTS